MTLAFFPMTMSPAFADDVYLANGSVFEDVVTQRTDTHVIIEMAIGKLTLPLSQVSKVVSADTPIAEFQRRHSTLLDNPISKAQDWLQLSRWGLANGLSSQAGQAALFAARLDPNLDGLSPMLTGLGYERLENVGWIPRSEAMRLRGKVLYDGEWMSLDQRTAHIAAARVRPPQQRRQEAPEPKNTSDNTVTDNAVALASIKLAEKALEQGERSNRRAEERSFRQPYGFGGGSYGYGFYSGIGLGHSVSAVSAEDAAAYNQRIQQDLKNLTNRVPGSIIPLNNRSSTQGSIFVARP